MPKIKLYATLLIALLANSNALLGQGIKISALPSASNANTGDELPANQSGTTRKLTPAQMLALLTGGAGINITGQSISTMSSEADFLVSGALTCGVSTQGKMQVHTTPLQYCDNAATPTLRYACYGNSSGESTAAANDSVALGTDTTGGYAASATESGSATSVAANSVTLTTDTIGNYAAGDAEAGSALSGDSATAFFSVGEIEDARIPAAIARDSELPTEASLEAILDLQDLQGAVTDAQVPNTITIDLATLATTANAGDSATAFFSAGQIESARGGTGIDASGSTGVPRISTGTWSINAGISHLASSSSADLAGVISDETGSGLNVFGTAPTFLTSILLDNEAELRFGEADVNGSNYLAFKSPAAITSNSTCTLENDSSPIPDSCVGDGVDGGGAGSNSFQTIDTPAGTDPVADSSTDTLTLACSAGVDCTGVEASDTIILTTASQRIGFLRDGDTTSLTCGADAGGKMQVLDNGKLEYCDGNDTSVLRSGYLDADGTDDDIPDADEVLESQLKAIDAAVDEECLTFETTTGDFEWQTCGGGGGIGGTLGTTDNAATRADGTGGSTAQGSALAIEDYVSTSPASDYVSITPFGADSIISTRLNYVGGNGSPGVYGAGILINGTSVGIQASGSLLKTWDGGGGNASILGGPDYYFNGTSATTPRFRQNGTTVEVILGDASAFAPLSAGDVKANGGFIAVSQTLTIADNGTGSPATGTLTVTKSYAKCDCGDADGCTITMSESGVVDGWQLTIVNISANACNFADTSGISELPSGGVALGQWDTLDLIYSVDRWAARNTSNN